MVQHAPNMQCYVCVCETNISNFKINNLRGEFPSVRTHVATNRVCVNNLCMCSKTDWKYLAHRTPETTHNKFVVAHAMVCTEPLHGAICAQHAMLCVWNKNFKFDHTTNTNHVLHAKHKHTNTQQQTIRTRTRCREAARQKGKTTNIPERGNKRKRRTYVHA